MWRAEFASQCVCRSPNSISVEDFVFTNAKSVAFPSFQQNPSNYPRNETSRVLLATMNSLFLQRKSTSHTDRLTIPRNRIPENRIEHHTPQTHPQPRTLHIHILREPGGLAEHGVGDVGVQTGFEVVHFAMKEGRRWCGIVRVDLLS